MTKLLVITLPLTNTITLSVFYTIGDEHYYIIGWTFIILSVITLLHYRSVITLSEYRVVLNILTDDRQNHATLTCTIGYQCNNN